MRKNILITGLPRSGKTTLLKKIISDYTNKIGFVTNEVRKNGERIGFELESHSGEKAVLANVNFKSKIKVSRYFVNINSLDTIIPKVTEFIDTDLLFLDEIGQIELFSENFKQLVLRYLDSSNICIATLSKIYSDDFTQQIRSRDDVIVVEISEKNRDLIEEYLKKLISKVIKAKKYIDEPKRFTIKSNEATIIADHGIRNMKKLKNVWSCDCKFFKKISPAATPSPLRSILRKIPS